MKQLRQIEVVIAVGSLRRDEVILQYCRYDGLTLWRVVSDGRLGHHQHIDAHMRN